MNRLLFIYFLILCSCSVHKKINGQQISKLLNESAIATGQIGICVYEPATGKYLYNHNASKYFIPASNVKLFTLYAGLKYLGDSLPGLKIIEEADHIIIAATGDPTLLHPYFTSQPIFDFLSKTPKQIIAAKTLFSTTAYGKGWSWDDYNESFMNEKSALPVYGNNIVFGGSRNKLTFYPNAAEKHFTFSFDSTTENSGYLNEVQRDYFRNRFTFKFNGSKKTERVIPFITSDSLANLLLEDTLHKKIYYPNVAVNPYDWALAKTLFSRPVDSLYIPMMYESDNFFAEQTLLMLSNKLWGAMNEATIIDSILFKDLKDIPQIPQWVDGSGLSRYNLFTPQAFVYLLSKMKNEFGLERMKTILPTGGQGTLKNYFLNDAGFIFAKTGTLSNTCSISGYLITKKNKLLIFSILNNNYISNTTPVKRAVEKYLHNLRQNH